MKHKPIPTLTESDLKRFWDKVEVRGPDDCWEWTGGVNEHGYGYIGKGRQNKFLVTRWAYFIEHGKDPGVRSVCHTCDNPPCCNPAHLWLGTHQDNVQDCVHKDRNIKGDQHGQAKLTEQDVQEIRTSNELYRILAERYGVSISAIAQIKNGKRWKHLPGRCIRGQSGQGERNSHAKLTEQDVRDIRKSNCSNEALAQRYGVGRKHISRIQRRIAWRHIK